MEDLMKVSTNKVLTTIMVQYMVLIGLQISNINLYNHILMEI